MIRWKALGITGLLLALGAWSAEAAQVDRIAAVVNDDVVTLSEVYDLGGPQIEELVRAPGGSEAARRKAELDVLDVLIERRLVEQEMTRLELDVTDIEVDQAITDIARQNNIPEENLRTEVEKSGLNWDTYRIELRSSLRDMKFNQQILMPRISIRDDELQDQYRRQKAAIAGPPSAHLETIYLPYPPSSTPEDQASVLALATTSREAVVVGGRAFGDVAAEVSAEPYRAQHGEMGTFRQGELVADLDVPAFSLATGDVGAPIVTPQGVFLLHVVERISSEAPPFEEVKDRLRMMLMQEKIVQAREQWLVQTRRRSSVKVFLEPAA